MSCCPSPCIPRNCNPSPCCNNNYNFPCHQCCSAPTSGCGGCDQARCRIPRCCRPGWYDQSYIAKKDYMHMNTRCQKCEWSPRFDDKFWNCRHEAPIYATRFDAPSPVKPPWCPPGCKTRSHFYPRYYKPRSFGFYPDECKRKPKCYVCNPTGTNCSGSGAECCRKWSIPLCPCPLVGRSRCFPAPHCCGCAPSPACVPKVLRACQSHRCSSCPDCCPYDCPCGPCPCGPCPCPCP